MRSLRTGRIVGSRGRLVAAAALVLALGAVEARADHVFTLSGVTFDDGGTATGTFTTNDALTSLVSFDITTSPGTNIGFEYTPATAGSSSTSLPFILVLDTPPALDNIIELTFTGLTAAGAPITIGQRQFRTDPERQTSRRVGPCRRRRRPRTVLASPGRHRRAGGAGDLGAETPGRMIP